MPTSTSTFSVDSASTTWTPGPTGVKINESLFVEATGSVVGLGSPVHYVEVEGSYPVEGYPPDHAFDPGMALHIDFLAIIAVRAGSTPASLSGDRSKWLSPRWSLKDDGVTRIARFYPSDFANTAGDSDAWDIYFGFTDTFYGDNSGSFSITTTVTDVDLQPAPLLSLPGHVTQEDIDGAAFCSFSGLLTPGNRLRSSSDGRSVADIFAPYLESGPREF
jgi:hypothetical protein